MDYRRLGHTDINVSRVCLGTMTFGDQTAQAEGFAQMDYAFEQGVNFFDTAELYAIPPKPETQGSTETIIGKWFERTGNRDKVVLATKVVGRTDMEWFRGESARLHGRHINEAIEASLRRLNTDYIDLYQLHWPDRKLAGFGSGRVASYDHFEDSPIPVDETLRALEDLVTAGKVRAIGLSNETPWGLSQFLSFADQLNLPKVVSVQNAYNLVNRSYESGLSEFYYRSGVGCLAYSPLAQGYLTGKYQNGALPEGSRKALFDRLGRYESDQSLRAIQAYCDLADNYEVRPSSLAQGWVMAQPFVTSNIIGATTLPQLEQALTDCEYSLSQELVAEIEAIHEQCPNPAP